MRKYTKEQRYFVEKEKIEKYLTCPICQDIFDYVPYAESIMFSMLVIIQEKI